MARFRMLRAVGILVAVSAAVCSVAGSTMRVSETTLYGEGAFSSRHASISADGRYIAFQSNANNLVADDTNNASDIFVHDRVTGQITRVSVSSTGEESDGQNFHPSISAEGRYVAFWSMASNLIAKDLNGCPDVFVHDRNTGKTTRMSIATGGVEGEADSVSPAISADGRYVVFSSLAPSLVPGDNNHRGDIFVRDRHTGTTARVSLSNTGEEANGASFSPSISGDGRYIAFESEASNLVTGDGNGKSDVFVRDVIAGTTTLVSVSTAGVQGNDTSYAPSISADGRCVAFGSAAFNLVQGDSNGYEDVFVRDRVANKTWRVSHPSGGGQANGNSYGPSISLYGRFVVFESQATNLIADDFNGQNDVFLFNRLTNQTTRVSVSTEGEASDGPSGEAGVSADGRIVVFSSEATNLVSGDDNATDDVFVHDTEGAGESIMVRHRPESDDPRYARTNPIVIAFAGRVYQAGAEARFTLRRGSTVIPGTFDWLLPQRKMRFRPTGPLSARAIYTVELAPGIALVGGGVTQYAESFSFRASNQPVVNGYAPQGTNRPRTNQIRVNFDQDMHRLSVQNTFKITPAVTGTFSWNGLREVLFIPDAPLAASTTYQIMIGRKARTVTGIVLGKAFTWEFTTTSAEAGNLVVSSAAAAPTPQGGAQVTFTLSAPAAVEVAVSNIAGRLVRRVATDAEGVVGLNTLVWDGRAENGLPTPSGRYLVRITARTESGSQSQVMAGVNVLRR